MDNKDQIKNTFYDKFMIRPTPLWKILLYCGIAGGIGGGVTSIIITLLQG